MQTVRCGESAQTVKAWPSCGRFPPAAYSTPDESLYSTVVEQAFLIHLRLFRGRTLETLSGGNDWSGRIGHRESIEYSNFHAAFQIYFFASKVEKGNSGRGENA